MKDAWDINVENAWRARFDHDGPHTPSTAEMERMLDLYGWYKK